MPSSSPRPFATLLPFLASALFSLQSRAPPCIDPEPGVRGQVSQLTLDERQDVSERIRVVIARRGITNPLLFAGIASAETQMAHCWRRGSGLLGAGWSATHGRGENDEAS